MLTNDLYKFEELEERERFEAQQRRDEELERFYNRSKTQNKSNITTMEKRQTNGKAIISLPFLKKDGKLKMVC